MGRGVEQTNKCAKPRPRLGHATDCGVPIDVVAKQAKADDQQRDAER
jgi:hypothetical protein